MTESGLVGSATLYVTNGVDSSLLSLVLLSCTVQNAVVVFSQFIVVFCSRDSGSALKERRAEPRDFLSTMLLRCAYFFNADFAFARGGTRFPAAEFSTQSRPGAYR